MWPQNWMSHRVANEIRTGSLTPLSQEFTRFSSEHSPAVPYIEGTTLAFLLLKGLKEPHKAPYRGNLGLKVGHKHCLSPAVPPTKALPALGIRRRHPGASALPCSASTGWERPGLHQRLPHWQWHSDKAEKPCYQGYRDLSSTLGALCALQASSFLVGLWQFAVMYTAGSPTPTLLPISAQVEQIVTTQTLGV